jgi:hypothetical protein
MVMTQEQQLVTVPYVACRFCCDGWLISSQHHQCFDVERQVWCFTCPNCRQAFEVPEAEINIQEIPLTVIRQKYPRFRLGLFSTVS